MKFGINTQALYDDFRSRGGFSISLVDVDAAIEASYGNVLANDPATYYGNYHSTYQAPLCLLEARLLFDQYR